MNPQLGMNLSVSINSHNFFFVKCYFCLVPC